MNYRVAVKGGKWFQGSVFFLALLLTLALLPAPAGAVLKDVGRVDPAHGFPLWYRDFSSRHLNFTQGLPLEICLSQTLSPDPAGGYMCNLLPVPGFVPENPIVFPTNFPDEAFWWSGDAIITTARYDATLVLGLEAAFGGGPVLAGDQVSFARVRIRVDTPEAGNYRITHPYGVQTFNNVPAGTRTINFTEDIGIGSPGVFTGALRGSLGPFLVWDTDFPVVVGDEMYVGDPNVEHTVTGSPFGTNFFRIERLDADGNVLETVETDLFAITGKIYTDPIPTKLKVDRATYSRDALSAQLDVFATAGLVSNVGLPSNLTVKNGNMVKVPMNSADGEKFVSHLEVAPDAIPATIQVINEADVPKTIRRPVLTDLVTITLAKYDAALQELTIEATSSDQLLPPTLTTAYGDLVAGRLVASGIAAAPESVEVVSSAGGKDVEPVTIAPTAYDRILRFAPNGGETLVSGTTFDVTWPSIPGTAIYRLLYSPDNGTTWIFIAGVNGSLNSYTWTVPGVAAPAPNSRLRVNAFDAGGVWIGTSLSNGVFTITPGL